MIKYQILPLKKFLEEYFSFVSLAQKDTYPLEPRIERKYLEQYERNSYALIALVQERIVGFSAFMLCKESRSNDLFGSNLGLYVEPEYRDSIVPGKLLVSTEAVAATMNCKSFKWDVVNGSALNKVLEKRKRYKKESVIYSTKL